MPTWREGVAWLASHAWSAVGTMYWLLNLLFVAAGMLSLVSKVVPVDNLARRSMTAAARRLLGIPIEDLEPASSASAAASDMPGDVGDDDAVADVPPSPMGVGDVAADESMDATSNDAAR